MTASEKEELLRLRKLVKGLHLLLTRRDPYFIVNCLNLIEQERREQAMTISNTKEQYMQPCPDCGGKGRLTEERIKWIACPRCKGMGEVPWFLMSTDTLRKHIETDQDDEGQVP